MRPSTTFILAAIGFMLLVGVIATLIWWRLADVIFPGTSERTGQYIGRRKGASPPPKAKVVSDFDSGAEIGAPPRMPSGPSDPQPPAASPPGAP